MDRIIISLLGVSLVLILISTVDAGAVNKHTMAYWSFDEGKGQQVNRSKI